MTDEITKKIEETKEQKKKTAIFSDEEIENTVKAFVLAYIHNRIDIRFPTPESIQENYEQLGKKLTDKQAMEKCMDEKDEFRNQVQICSGTMEATDEERKFAIHSIFSLIILAKQNGRLTGSFEDYDLKKKVDELEDKLSVTNNVITKLIEWLTESEKGMNGNLS